MSTLPDFRQILRQDLPGSPDWVNGIISPVNLFAEQTYTLLNGGLDFTNFRGSIAAANFTTPNNYADGTNTNFTPFTFPITFNGASIVFIGNCIVNSGNYSVSAKPLTLPVGGWRETSSGKITVYYLTGLAPSTSYKVTFLVF